MKSNLMPGSHGGKGPMRQWSAPSYDASSGRSVSSVDEQGARVHVTNNNHALAMRKFLMRSNLWTANVCRARRSKLDQSGDANGHD
jgi:hypothetical protein